MSSAGNGRAASGSVLCILSVLCGCLQASPVGEDGNAVASVRAVVPTPKLQLLKHDRIIIIGNTFAERMALFSHFETALTVRYPGHRFTVRNLGWSGDTLKIRQRPHGFGDLHRHLGEQKADVIIACFGMADSFDGPTGVPDFRGNLAAFIGELLANQYNGHSAPRVALVSPISHESIDARLSGDPTGHNRDLAAYTAAMREVAAEFAIPFVDLLSISSEFMNRQAAFPLDSCPAPLATDESLAAAGKLTFNGIHPTDTGYWVISSWLLAGLGHESTRWNVALDRGGGPTESTGTVISEVEFSDTGVRFFAADFNLPPPPPPPAAARLPAGATGPAAARQLPALKVLGLRPGRYELTVNGNPAGAASAAELEKGITIFAGPGVELVKQLRARIVEKNDQFFHLWRPVNGEYIFGRRMKPFGVINFPGELDALAEMIRMLENEIHSMCQSPAPMQFELSPADP